MLDSNPCWMAGTRKSDHACSITIPTTRRPGLATAGQWQWQAFRAYEKARSGSIPSALLQVYDLRSAGAPRMASSVAFNAGPAMLRFLPKFSSTVLLTSTNGTFTLADAGGGTFNRYQQVSILPLGRSLVL